MPARFEAVGDRHAGIDDAPGILEALLELSARHERDGLGDAPWPPHYRKQAGEPARVQPSKRRVVKHPLVEIGRAKRKEDALAGLERWKARHPEAAGHLEPADVLVDAMRGRYRTWTRIRVNLQHVPVDLRPSQEPLDPDDGETWGPPADFVDAAVGLSARPAASVIVSGHPEPGLGEHRCRRAPFLPGRKDTMTMSAFGLGQRFRLPAPKTASSS